MEMYKISQIIAKKKRYIFTILIAVFVLIVVATTVIGSFSLYQYDTTKKNFVDNQFAKTIEITSYSPRSNETRKLNSEDAVKIKEILKNTDVICKTAVEYLIHFGIPTGSDDVIFLKSFSDDFFVEGSLTDPQMLISKRPDEIEELTLNIPVIRTEGGGFVSDSTIPKTYHCLRIDDSSILSGYFKEDEIIAPEAVFKEITNIMFPDEHYVDVEKIYVNVDDISEIKSVADLLSSEKYDVKHAFEYYNDLDVSVGRLLNFSLIVLVLLLVFALAFMVSTFELSLRNSVGDIAVLKHLGFKSRAINKIYLYPMVGKISVSVLAIFIFNMVLLRFEVINNLTYAILFTAAGGVLGGIVLIIMLVRVDYYSKKGVLSLVEKYKVEE